MAELKASASLGELQAYATEHAIERGFNDSDAVRECLLLAEEVGELANALRKREGFGVDLNSHFGDIEHELADVLWVTVMIANITGVNLEEAFRSKEAINHDRTWTPDTKKGA